MLISFPDKEALQMKKISILENKKEELNKRIQKMIKKEKFFRYKNMVYKYKCAQFVSFNKNSIKPLQFDLHWNKTPIMAAKY